MKIANAPIEGQYHAAFAPLATQFSQHFSTGQETGASLCVYPDFDTN
jgi:hypothetical protein